MSDNSSVVDLVDKQHETAYKQAEAVMRSAQQDGRNLSFEELTFLETKMGWDTREAKRQLSRIGRVIRYQDEAGTPEQRAKLKAELDNANETLNTKGKELEELIREKTRELKALQDDQQNKQRRVDECQQACEHLRSQLPPHVQRRIDMNRGALNSSVRAEAISSKAEADQLQRLLDFEPAKHRPAELRDFYSGYKIFDGLVKYQGGKWVPTFDADQVRATIADLREHAAHSQAQYDAELEKLQELKDYYVG